MIRMLINALEKEEIRIAKVVNGTLDEFYIERPSKETLVGNIYKGRVENVHRSLESAFVNIGLEKNGFLHISEALNPGERRMPNYKRRIEKTLSVGQEILVQVTRDSFGEKGPSLTMQISLAGRYLVLTPNTTQIGVSKKITDFDMRRFLRKELFTLKPKDKVGFIIRTASKGMSRDDLSNDLDGRVAVWREIVKKSNAVATPSLLYRESDLMIRIVRDTFTKEVDEIIVDEAKTYSKLADFFQSMMPKLADRVKFYSSPMQIFTKYEIQKEIEKLESKRVDLPSGGSIIIDRTEALIAIDVNSGKFVRTRTPEETSLKTNLEAAREIMRQVRFRDLGGVIVIDFIDMRQFRNKREVERVINEESRRDRSQMVILPMSQFSLVQIARQKSRQSLELLAFDPCPHCGGRGVVKSAESVAISVLRQLRTSSEENSVYTVEVRANPQVIEFIKAKREMLDEVERNLGIRTYLNEDSNLPIDKVELSGYNLQGEKVMDYVT